MIRAAASLRALVPLPRLYEKSAEEHGKNFEAFLKVSSCLGSWQKHKSMFQVRLHVIASPYYQMDIRGQDEITMLTTRRCHSSSENQGAVVMLSNSFYFFSTKALKFSNLGQLLTLNILCLLILTELAKKSCVPCNSKDLHPMSEDSAKKLLEQVDGWELTTEGGSLKLHRAWKVKNFVKGLEFFQLVAAIAEGEGHHPDLHLVGWNNVKIDVWTHSVRGLTENDFVLAAKINHLNLEGLLSKKKTSV